MSNNIYRTTSIRSIRSGEMATRAARLRRIRQEIKRWKIRQFRWKRRWKMTKEDHQLQFLN